MKTLEELNALKEQSIIKYNIGPDAKKIKVLVGMATCGISAGATPVYDAFVSEINKQGLDVKVTQTGCIGICCLEPVVEVFVPGKEKVTYVKMTPDKVAKIIENHLKNNEVVTEYTIGAAQ